MLLPASNSRKPALEAGFFYSPNELSARVFMTIGIFNANRSSTGTLCPEFEHKKSRAPF
jgi:hypothetical protein